MLCRITSGTNMSILTSCPDTFSLFEIVANFSVIDNNTATIIDIFNVYGPKFYDYHCQFSAKAAVL
jgi:hypothetical protein